MKQIFYPILLLSIFIAGCVKKLTVEETQKVNRETFHSRKTGASARELLSDETYKALTVEIQYMTGYKPETETVRNVTKFLETYLRKPAGVHVVLSEIDTSVNKAMSMEDVLSVEKAERTEYTSNKEIAIYLLFTNGIHPGNKILGMAYRNTSAVIYGQAIHDNSSSTTTLTRAELETSVALHEIGHLLGLINKESSIANADESHPDHCKNKNCLMYYATETRHVFKDFLKGNIPALDSDCIDLLIANGGKPLQSKY